MLTVVARDDDSAFRYSCCRSHSWFKIREAVLAQLPLLYYWYAQSERLT